MVHLWGLFNFIFTGVDFKDIEYEHLAEAIREVCKEQNLAAIDGQVRMAYLYCRIRLLILIPIQITNQMGTWYNAELFTLHRVRYELQS